MDATLQTRRPLAVTLGEGKGRTMKTDADALRLWLMNDEGLYSLIVEAALNGPDTAVDYVTEGLEIALDFDNLSAFQLEFMPRMDSWQVRDMVAALISEQREEGE